MEIMVYPLGNPGESRQIEVSDVRIGEIAGELYERLQLSLDNQENITDPRNTSRIAFTTGCGPSYRPP